MVAPHKQKAKDLLHNKSFDHAQVEATLALVDAVEGLRDTLIHIANGTSPASAKMIQDLFRDQ